MSVSKESAANFRLDKKEKILYYLVAALLPNIFLFVLYNGNREDTKLVFGHVLILALILMAIGAIGLLLNRLIVRNYEGAMSVLSFALL